MVRDRLLDCGLGSPRPRLSARSWESRWLRFPCWKRWPLIYGEEGQLITAVLDAGRGELYVGDYSISGQRAELKREYIAKQVDFLADAAALKSPVITTHPALAESGGANVVLVKPLQADAIGRIGLRKLLAGDTVDPATLDANYIRRSDAELYTQPKR